MDTLLIWQNRPVRIWLNSMLMADICWINFTPVHGTKERTSTYQENATQAHLAKAVKEVVSIPVLTQGKLGDPQIAESVLSDGKADFVGLGHSALADPAWPNKIKNGLTYAVVPCIYCNECLYDSFSGKGTHCAINPLCGWEKDYPLAPVSGFLSLVVDREAWKQP